MQIHFSGSDGSEKPDESTSSYADDCFWNYPTRKKNQKIKKKKKKIKTFSEDKPLHFIYYSLG